MLDLNHDPHPPKYKKGLLSSPIHYDVHKRYRVLKYGSLSDLAL